MKKYLVIIPLLLWGSLSISLAQQPTGKQGPADGRPAGRMLPVDYKQIGERLQLTEEQKAHWDLLAGKYASEIESIKEDGATATDDRKEKFKDIATRMRTDLQGVLTESQLKAFDELTAPKAPAEKGQGKGPKGGGGRRGGMGM